MKRPRLRLRAQRNWGGARRTLSVVGGGLVLVSGLLAGAPASADGPAHVLYAWGDTRFGELGDGTPIDPSYNPAVDPPVVRATPVPVVDHATNVTQVSADAMVGVALHSDGTVWTWGYSPFLGDGGTASRSTPGKVPGLPPITQIDTGAANVSALGADGTVWGWGWDTDGQLGDGGSPDLKALPVKASISGVVRIAAGQGFMLAQKSNGEVWAWGKNDLGQLGNGTTTASLTPVRVALPSGIVQIAAGSDFGMALAGDGKVWTWGENTDGEQGIGTTVSRSTPAPTDARVSGITQISAGLRHAMALAGDGTVWAWGFNARGEIGDGTTTDRPTPVHLSLTGIARVDAGWGGSTAITSGGRLYYWGSNKGGATGLSTVDPITQPTLDTRLFGVTGAAVTGTYPGPIIFALAAAGVTVPNLRGMKEAAATSAITAAGLTVGTVTHQAVATSCTFNGIVWLQSPTGGTAVPSGSKVNITVLTVPRC